MRTAKLRKILAFVLGGILFVSVAVFALILARGQTLTDDGLIETGTVRLNIEPNSDYKVFLNEQSRTVANDTVRGVLPGTYQMLVQKEGYTNWQQEVEVKAGLVTDVAVQLFPEELQLTQISQTNVDSLMYNHDGSRIYYIVRQSPQGANVGLWQQNLESSIFPIVDETPVKISNLTGKLVSALDNNSLEITANPNSDKLLLKANTEYYVLSTTRYNEPSETTIIETPYPIDKVEWFGQNNLVVKSGNLLIDYNLSDKRSTVIHYAQNLIYTVSQSDLTFWNGEDLVRYTPGTPEVLALENIVLPVNISSIAYPSNDNKSLIITADNDIYFLQIPESLLLEIGSYDLISVSPDGTKLIVQTAGQIKSIELDISLLRDEVTLSLRDTEIPANIVKETLVWSPNSSFVVFRTSDQPNAILSTDSTGRNLLTLLDSPQLTASPYKVMADGTGLLVRLTDETPGTTQRANIYKLAFEE